MKSKILINKRCWLNKKSADDSGSIQYSVSVDDFDISSEFILRDCGRQVILNLCFYNKKWKKQRTKKINKLINALTEIRDIMPKAEKLRDKMKKKQKKKDKKK